jgi:predicted transcriptional regulator
MDKKQIETILKIKEIGNITKVADYIGVTQPTLSKFLSSTESKFGVQIFYRYARSLKPTEEGEILLNNFSEMLNIYNNCEQQIMQFRSGHKQEFQVGTHQVLGKFIIPKIEDKILKQKDIHLSYSFMNSRKVTEEVINGHLDLGIVADPQKYPELVIKPLWKEYIGLYSKDGKRKNTVIYNSNMIFANKTLNKLTFKEKRKIDDYSIIHSILKRTNQMGLLPNPIAESENKLKLIEKFQPYINICLIYSSSKAKTKGLSKVLSIIKDCSKK